MFDVVFVVVAVVVDDDVVFIFVVAVVCLFVAVVVLAFLLPLYSWRCCSLSVFNPTLSNNHSL